MLSDQDIKKIAKILVIDDKDFPFLDIFKKSGFLIEKWDDVDDMRRLEEGVFDLILLDLNGVGLAFSPKDQGLHVLKHLKSINKSQLIVAYSNENWSVDTHCFFSEADKVINKQTADYSVFSSVAIELLRSKFTLRNMLNEFYIKAGVSCEQKTEIEALAEKDSSEFKSSIAKIGAGTASALGVVANIVSILNP